MKHTWILAALVGAAACVSPEAHRQTLGENAALRAQIADLAEKHQQLANSYDRLQQEKEQLGARALDAAYIEQRKKELDDLLRRFPGFGESTGSGGVKLINTSEGPAFQVEGQVLFASGSNKLTDQGRRALQGLVNTLRDRRVRVDGHTDDEPIRNSNWQTNLRLSVERALSVADFLIEAGVPKPQVSVAGYGEFRPAVEGSTPEARQQNRRVVIQMLER